MIAISITLLGMILWVAGPSNVLRPLQDISGWTLVGIFLLLVANLFVVSLRLWRVHNHFGIALPWAVAYRACLSGQVAGLMVISLFGQTLGRQSVLRGQGISPTFSASLVAYERGIMTVLGGALCVLGAAWLLGWTKVSGLSSRLSLGEVMLAVIGGAALSLLLGRSRFETRLIARLRLRRAASRLLEISGITLISSFLMFSVFVLAIHAVQPQVGLLSLFAASTVISFAASMPISVNGWGIREVAAVYMLKPLGVSSAQAISASVLVGLCSTIVVLAAAPWILHGMRARTSNDVAGIARAPAHVNLEKAAAWILSMAAALLIFFQVHIQLGDINGIINLNLADPFALLTLAVVVAHGVSVRHAPQWRAKHFNAALIILSVVLIFAFLRGMAEIGVTQWAFAARLLGWLVVLGYISAGYLIVSYTGVHGLRRLAETLVATGVVVVLLQITLRWFTYFGLYPDTHSPNFEGYAANRNAFAFEMLICMTLILAYSTVIARWYSRGQRHMMRSRIRVTSILLGIVLLGLILSTSRAGLLCGLLILLVALAVKFVDRRTVAYGACIAAIIWGLIVFLPLMQGGQVIQNAFSGDASDTERLLSINKGMAMWMQSPILGAGLGVFYERSEAWYGKHLIIHNTPVWILAEFGIIGAIAFGWMFYVLARPVLKKSRLSNANRILCMILLCFAVFSLAHEIFYQRIFWLVLGAALAYPGGRWTLRDNNA